MSAVAGRRDPGGVRGAPTAVAAPYPGTVSAMQPPTLIQTGPETFDLLLGAGRVRVARLAQHTRRGLGLTGIPPLQIATEIVAILSERGEALAGEDPLDLGPALGRDPAGFEELRVRLA